MPLVFYLCENILNLKLFNSLHRLGKYLRIQLCFDKIYFDNITVKKNKFISFCKTFAATFKKLIKRPTKLIKPHSRFTGSLLYANAKNL